MYQNERPCGPCGNQWSGRRSCSSKAADRGLRHAKRRDGALQRWEGSRPEADATERRQRDGRGSLQAKSPTRLRGEVQGRPVVAASGQRGRQRAQRANPGRLTDQTCRSSTAGRIDGLRVAAMCAGGYDGGGGGDESTAAREQVGGDDGRARSTGSGPGGAMQMQMLTPMPTRAGGRGSGCHGRADGRGRGRRGRQRRTRRVP